MRPVAISITVAGLLAGLLTGCGERGEEDAVAGGPTATPATGPAPTFAPPPTGPPAHGWEGTVEIDFGTGELTAPGFNQLIDADPADWATDPESTVTVLLHLTEPETEGEVEITVSGDDAGPVVEVTHSRLADDSVAALRYRITLASGDDGRYRFDDGEVSWRCQPDRGPQEFGTAPCT